MRFFVHLASYSYVTTASSEPRGRAMMNLLCITMIRKNMMMTMIMIMIRTTMIRMTKIRMTMIRMTILRMRRRWVL